MIDYMRSRVFSSCDTSERLHAVFLGKNRCFLGEITFEGKNSSELSLRMRDLFSKALNVETKVMIIAHNHPSGDCRPSAMDIQVTSRIAALSEALDIELADHLIFTRTAVYSMRAGGDL
ncbi:JAB domain-containing protein [Erythrobacter sp. YT30]|uniref:JAB domain-containing protein n=1 Tax=Erythrobacter sp. YT30 TaxID=1735012 RepID=UPI0018D21A69|nr:JAB domain-containing protein [Erythrobacter sp. YT30]